MSTGEEALLQPPLLPEKHEKAGGAGGGEASAQRFDGRPGQRHVVAHLCDVAAEAAEVGLHVDEHEGDVIGVE